MDEDLVTLKAKLRQLRIDIVREQHKDDSPKFMAYKALEERIKSLETTATATAEAKPVSINRFFALKTNSEPCKSSAAHTAKP